ncbi:MAG TPA: AAA family ATPase [Candidatus Dormibacteraeota bacterium]|nr:AAA family ATPase [Candidatus Dormibacteraeota bacterium]
MVAAARVICPAFVGRESELSQLEDSLLSAVRGEGGVTVLGGEAGMGKSRLVRELSQRAERLGCAVMSGGCSEAELSLPYLPFLEAIGNYLTRQDVAALRERLGAAAGDLAQLFPQMGHAAAVSTDPVMSKLRLFEAMMLLLTDAARNRGVLLVIEDLHWADPATRELVDYATRRLRSTRVMMLATYRTDELHRKHALLPSIQAWRRSGLAQLMEIDALDATSVKAMVMSIFEEVQVSDEFRDFMRERSEGNPFVLEEMLRDAIDRGDIFRTERGWDRKAVHEIRVPRTVRDAILHRLAGLQPVEVEVLSAASAVGITFDVAMLAAVTGKPDSAVAAALEACVANQLLEEADREAGRYCFRHALTRETVYEDIVASRRQQLHARIAEVLEARPDWKAVDLAHHLLMAGSYEQAVGMCVAAAEQALAAHAYRDAADLFERAIPHVKDVVERSRLMCRAADAYWNNTETQAAKGLLEEGIAGLEAAGLTVEAAGHRLLLGRCYWELLRTDLAREQFIRARDVLETQGPSEALAVAYLRLSLLASIHEGGSAGLEEAHKAAEIARHAGSAMALAWSWNFIALPTIATGHLDEGFEYFERSYVSAREGNFHFQTLNAIYNASWCAIHVGRGREARKWVGREEEWGGESWPYYTQSLLALHEGRVSDAMRLARTALRNATDAGNEKNIWRSRVMLAQVLAERDLHADAAAELPPVSSRVEGQDAIYDTTARVRTQLAAGDGEAAFEAVRDFPPRLTHFGSPADAIAEAAGSQPEWLHQFVEGMPNQDVDPPLLRAEVARGRLALAEGRVADAERTLAAAVARLRQEGFVLDAWHASRALASAEVGSGNRDRAAALLDQTVVEAERAGAMLAARLARETAGRLGLELAAPTPAAPATEVVGPVGERMVSVLFADVRGYTEIAGASAPSELVDRIASLQRWAAQEVARHSGIVDKFAGDAVMATFNVTGQTVDHAQQAVRAAIAIIDKAALVGLPVGAGVAVGPAVVGRLAESANVSVLGSVTNLAARLQAEARAGEVVISDEAHRRVGEWLEAEGYAAERVSLHLKGFAEPVTAFRLQARAGIRA